MKKSLTTLFILYSIVLQGQDLNPPLRYIGIPNSNYRFDDGLQIDGTLYPKGGIWIPTIITLGGAGDSVLSKNQTTGMVELVPQGSVSLTNGEATTANGTAVDLGGTHTGSVNIVSGGGGANFSIDNIGQTGISFGDVTDNNAGAILHLASFQAYWDGTTNHNNTFGINKTPDNNVALDVLGTAVTMTSGTDNAMKARVGGWLIPQAGFDSTRYDAGGGANYTIFTNNILIGDSAGYNIPTFSTAVDDSMTGHNNIFIGRWAGKNAIKPFANIFIGNAAGMNTIGEWNSPLNIPFLSGFENTVVGNYAFELNITGFENTAIGTAALRKNINGSDNVAVGLSALQDNISGGSNTAVGVNAAIRNTTGVLNVAVGHAANKEGNTTYNTAVGAQALELPTGGIRNTALGAVALQNMTSGKFYNVGLGMAAGLNSGGDNCTYLGAYAGSFNTQDNMLFIENQPQGVSTSEADDTTKSLVVARQNFNPTTSRFRINATPFIANGDQGAGKVLTCTDANGRATWQTGLTGTATNDAAAAGIVGEEINSTISTYANYSATATYQNVTSIALTAGDWDISAFFTYSSNGATITAASNSIFVISTTTASAAGATEGLNIAYIPQAALLGTSLFSEAISPYRVSLSGNTTYYLNTQATFTLGNPQYVGSIRARRMR